MGKSKPHQRKGSKSNAHVGSEFEKSVQRFFTKQGIQLKRNLEIRIGINGKKAHKFDLGNKDSKIIVECKSHTWTKGRNVPSGKMKAWNEAMYLFHVAPKSYRKIFFVLRHYNQKKKETLAEYYIRTYQHLIPAKVEIWEYNEATRQGRKLK